jgi:hypothetical protein
MKPQAEDALTHPDRYPRPAYVRMSSWAGTTRHRVILRGKRVDGKYMAYWDDEPAFRYTRGVAMTPPPYAVEEVDNHAG